MILYREALGWYEGQRGCIVIQLIKSRSYGFFRLGVSQQEG